MNAGRSTCRRGFTLVEALVAGVILAMFASVIALGATRSLNAVQSSRDQQEAAMLLDVLLTRVDLYGPDRLLREGPRDGDFEPPFDRFTWEIDVEPLAVTDMYEIVARVRWQGRGSRLAEAHTRLYDPPNSRSDAVAWEDL